MKKYQHPLYKKWYNYHYCCTNPNSKFWRLYGGRGIKLARSWQGPNGFWNFVRWVNENLGPQPSAEHRINRIDINADIKPGNLRWATQREVSRNRFNNHYVRYQGQRRTLAEWSEITGINFKTLWSRLHDHGMKPKEAFNQDVRTYTTSN